MLISVTPLLFSACTHLDEVVHVRGDLNLKPRCFPQIRIKHTRPAVTQSPHYLNDRPVLSTSLSVSSILRCQGSDGMKASLLHPCSFSTPDSRLVPSILIPSATLSAIERIGLLLLL
ncbi:hypothetical protein EDB89DRAFT_798639 [Lactarius sanguifluus]|nr:hypothetical protein EDB89DRAFT_798639 [Lactarius sanguifluus]